MKRARLLIGFCGPEGAGKSTVARALSDALHGEIRPFAGPLKSMLAAAGVPHENLYGTPEQKAAPLPMLCGRSARHAMQTLGTEWRDTIGRDLWLNLWLAVVEASPHQFIFADDVRFGHEARAIQARGGLVLRVMRSPADVFRVAKHPSEDFMAVPYDGTVINSGSLDAALQDAARVINLAILRRIKKEGSENGSAVRRIDPRD